MASVSMRFGAIITPSGAPEGSGTGSTNITNVTATAETLPEGSSATAAASLTESNLTLTFGIPTGATGATGPRGETGPQGEPGTSAVLGAAYSGSYTGTGTYGSANPNTLSFTTPPSTVIITRADSTGFAAQMVLQQGSEQAVFTSTNTSNTYHRVNKVTWSNDGKTVSWYCAQDAGAQCNESGESYTYVAIGTGEIACTVDVGTVSTGSTASVTNSGTAQQAVLNFVLPQTQTANNVQNTGDTGQIEFSLDANGKGLYRAVGASTWIPFLSGGGDAYDALDTDNALWFGTAQSDEFANNASKTFTLTGLTAGNEYLVIPCQVLGTGTPHMWLGDHTGYTQSFSGASVVDEKTAGFWRFQRLSVTTSNPTMTIRNSAGYRNRFETLVLPL